MKKYKKLIICIILYVYILQLFFPIMDVYAISNNKIPKNPKLVNVIENIVELEKIDGYEYSKDGTIWQDSPIFKYLDPLTEYNFVQRIKANGNYDASIISEPINVKTNSITNSDNIPQDYIVINNYSTYNSIFNNRNGKFILMIDIDFEEQKSKYSGFGGTFSGTFNGNGHYLKNGEVDGTSALFNTNNGTIIGLGIINAHLSQYSSSSSTIQQLQETYSFVVNNNGVIKDCYTSISDYTKYKNPIFGIARFNKGTIENCYSDVNSSNHSGPIACQNEKTGIISKCYNMGYLSKNDDAGDQGGIVDTNIGIIENCSNIGMITGGFSVTGGIAGYNKGLIRNCNNNATVKSYGISGGIVGKNIKYQAEDVGLVECSYNIGTINDSTGIAGAGIVGENYGDIKNCYNEGKINSKSAGIAYANGGNIRECFNIGETNFGISAQNSDFKIPFTDYVGCVTNSYYISNSNKEQQEGTELSENDIKIKTSYNGFDFISIWKLNDSIGHATLINQGNIIEIEAISDTKITLKSRKNSLYSINGIDYQSSNEICNLQPNTVYTVYQKDKDTNITYRLNIKTDKYTPINLLIPEIERIEGNYIQLKKVDGYEYSIDGKLWQDNTGFSHLQAVTEYTVYQRIKKTDTSYQSNITQIKVKTTKKDAPYYKSTPKIDSITSTSVILKFDDRYEYSKDRQVWQDSSIFENLTPNTEYTFYERAKETTDTKVGEIGEALIVKTPKNEPPSPLIPEIEYKNKNVIIIKNIPGYEYKINNMNFQDSNIFEDLDPNTEYNVYQRYKETDITKAGIITSIKVTTNNVIIFDANEGVCDVSSLDINEKLNNMPVATKDGYEFLGWYSKKDGGEKITLDTIFESSTTVFAHYKKIEILKGDTNNDGKINNKDWALLYLYINGTKEFSNIQLLSADVNGDGKVNNKDWNRLYKHINGTEPLD